LRIESLEDAGTLAISARDALTKFFDQALGGTSGRGWPLSREPVEADIAYALAEAAGLAGIAFIELREIDADGHESGWRGSVRKDEIVLLAEDGVRIEFESLEVQS
jgi:hypothetical protein